MIEEADETIILRVKRFGQAAAVLSFVFYVLFDLAAVAGMTGMITSPFVISLSWYAPSLLLAYSFLGMTIAMHHDGITVVKLYSFCAMALAVIYATLNSFVYVIQVMVVAPSFLSGTSEAVSLFEMAEHRPLYAVNGLAYTIMGFSTLFLAASIRKVGPDKGLKTILFIHGIVAPAVLGALLFKPLFALSATVGITYPVAALMIAKYFRRSAILRQGNRPGSTGASIDA